MSTLPYNMSSGSASTLSTAFSTSSALTQLYDKCSVSLTTGKSVNTCYDNTTLYLKDMRLSESAQSLLSIIDGLTNIVSTVDTAATALDSITEFLLQAQAAATSAIEENALITNLVGTNLSPEDETLMSDLPFAGTGDEIIIRTGDADEFSSDYYIEKDATLQDMGISQGESLRIKVGDNEWVTLDVIDEEMKVLDFFNQVIEITGDDSFLAEIEDNTLTLSTNDKSSILLEGELAEALGFNLEDTHVIAIEDDWTVYDFRTAISDIEGLQATINSEGYLEITSIYGDDLMVYDLTGSVSDAFGFEGCNDGGENTILTYSNMYNEALSQIDNLVNDASFNGLNLLQGDTIKAIFDENATSMRTIEGVMVDAESLGLSEALNWENPEEAEAAIQAIEEALSIVEAAANQLARSSYMIQSREDYLQSLSNTFQAGVDTLTGADLNEASAELLAIQTQKELVNEVISITLEVSSSVLRLFS